MTEEPHIACNVAATPRAAVAAPDRGPHLDELALGRFGGAGAAALVLRSDDLVELLAPTHVTR